MKDSESGCSEWKREGLNEREDGRLEVEAGPHEIILCQNSFTVLARS